MTQTLSIWKDFTFEAAHMLPNVPIGHPCRRIHGHSYRVRVWLREEIDPEMGWVVDFGDISNAVKPLIERLDHQYLNDFFDNPTCEHLALWFWEELEEEGSLPISRVDISETPGSGARYPA